MKKRKKRNRIRFRHIFIVFIIVYISMIVSNQNKVKEELSLKQKQVQMEIESLQEDIGELNREVEIKGSIEFIENTAREELGMVKPNEIIYIDKDKVKNSIFSFFNKHND